MRQFQSLLLPAILFNFSTLASANEMDGKWVSVSRISAGVQQMTLPAYAVIKDGKFNTEREGKLSELGNISETTTTPINHYNVEMTGEVELSGKSFHGIFAVSGDTMFTCVNPEPSGDRPTAFSSTKDNGNVLIVWMRKETLAKLNAMKKPMAADAQKTKSE